MVDLYEVLGVSRDADVAAIWRAFRKKVRATYPDGGGSVEAFNELKTAMTFSPIDPSRPI